MRTSFLSFGLFGLVLISIAFDVAHGQAKKENLEEILQKAKDEFRSKSDELEVKLILALEQRIESARKAGDKKALDLATSERDQFKADGTLPKMVEKAAQTFQRQSAAARKKLEQVYRNLVKEYVKTSQDEKAHALQMELEKLLAIELEDFSQTQLIRNGDCEEELSGIKAPAWVAIYGKWERRTNEPPPHSGTAYFSPAESPEAELGQEIDLGKYARRIDDGLVKFEFTGYVRSWPADKHDTSRIILEFLDGTRKKTLDTFDSGELAGVDSWRKVSDSRAALKGIRWVRIRLKSKRYAGVANDGYYDSLSLKVVPVKDQSKG